MASNNHGYNRRLGHRMEPSLIAVEHGLHIKISLLSYADDLFVRPVSSLVSFNSSGDTLESSW